MATCGLRRALYQTSSICRKNAQRLGRRTILSDAHCCRDAWKERLQTPILQKVDVGEFALRIQEKLDKSGVQKIDMDVLANKLEDLDSQQIEFVQNLFYRFRHTNETIQATDSMSHAVVRALTHFGETERLLHILKDKINYGIFLDDFSANFLLDYFIKKEQYHEAAQVAYDVMLQQDLTHPVVRHLAWYACDKHWRRMSPAAEMQSEGQEEMAAEDEEEVWTPVSFIRHPWYDDHWDIDRDSLLLGKTFTAITRHEEQDMLTASYQLLGLGLHEKFTDCLELLAMWVESADRPTVSREATAGLMSVLEALETQELPEEEKDAGSLTMDDVRPYVTAQQKQDFLQQTKEAFDRLESQGQIVEVSLESLIEEKLQKIVQILEPKDIEDQIQLFRRWNEERACDIQAQIDEVRNYEKREKIAIKLRDLQAREEKLSYFEDQEKVMLGISRAPKLRPIEQVEEEEQFVAPPTERGRNF